MPSMTRRGEPHIFASAMRVPPGSWASHLAVCKAQHTGPGLLRILQHSHCMDGFLLHEHLVRNGKLLVNRNATLLVNLQ